MSEVLAIPLHLEETNAFELLEASLRPLVEQGKKANVVVHVAKLGDVPHVLVDREKVAWAATALVGNALRYLASTTRGEVGGSIVVHTTHESAAHTVSISVQDDGPGIPDDKLPFLFERRRGAIHADGLALMLVRQIISAHGGRIEVESRRELDDHGTSITLVFPLRRA
jgi:signal transduction histidine kinase